MTLKWPMPVSTQARSHDELGYAGVAFTYDRYGHLVPEVDEQAAAKLEAHRVAARLA